MRAAVEAASKNTEAPPLLREYWQCQNWGALPRAGGMDDQDYRKLYLMRLLHRAYDAAYAWNTATKKQPMTDAQNKMFKWLISSGIA